MTHTEAPPGDVLSVQQLADYLGCSLRTALRRVQDGEIPARKLPGRTGAWVIDRRDLPDAEGKRPDPQGKPDHFAA